MPEAADFDERVTLPDGLSLRIRPVRAEDKPALLDLVDKMSPDDVRARFRMPKDALSEATVEAVADVEGQDMTFVATPADSSQDDAIVASVQLRTGRRGKVGEYAIMVRGDMQGQGLGSLLMRRIIEYGRRIGVGEIIGEVRRDNQAMRALCEKLGFVEQPAANEPRVIEVRLAL